MKLRDILYRNKISNARVFHKLFELMETEVYSCINNSNKKSDLFNLRVNYNIKNHEAIELTLMVSILKYLLPIRFQNLYTNKFVFQLGQTKYMPNVFSLHTAKKT